MNSKMTEINTENFIEIGIKLNIQITNRFSWFMMSMFGINVRASDVSASCIFDDFSRKKN